MNIHKSQLFWCELQGYYWSGLHRSGPCGPPKPLKAVLDLEATSDGWIAEYMLLMITIITIIAMIKIIVLPWLL